MRMRVSHVLLGCVSAAAVVCCADDSSPKFPFGGADTTPGPGRVDAGTDAARESGTIPATPLTPSADASTTPPRGPDSACAVPDQAGGALKLEYRPSAPITAQDVYVTATDADTAYTEISLAYCTPNGLVYAQSTTVESAQKPYSWSWAARRLPAGTTQIQFIADPNMTVYATQRISVSN